MQRNVVKHAVIGVLALIGIVVLMLSWFTVDQGYVAVITKNGAAEAAATAQAKVKEAQQKRGMACYPLLWFLPRRCRS